MHSAVGIKADQYIRQLLLLPEIRKAGMLHDYASRSVLDVLLHTKCRSLLS